MRKFIKKILILIIMMLFSAFAIALFSYYVVGSQYTTSYQASLIDKVKRLKSIDEPKIILVGNSNVAFGCDSELIEKELGMPVVNLGYMSGFGNAFHEDLAKINMNKGDIVVVCHTSYDDDSDIYDYRCAWISYDYNDEMRPLFIKKDRIKGMLKWYPTYVIDSFGLWLLNRGNEEIDSCFARESFNEYGDVVYKPYPLNDDEFFKNGGNQLSAISSVCTDRLNEFNKYCIEQDAMLVIAGWPIGYGDYSQYTINDVVEYQEELEDKLDFEVISDFTDYLFPYDYFYNSTNHLDENGTKIRTEQLILDLKRWME